MEMRGKRYMNLRLIILDHSKNAMENLKCKMKTTIEIIKQYVYRILPENGH